MSAADTSHCPRGPRCECCGRERPDVRVEVVVFGRLGVGCLNLCRGCATSGVEPPITAGTAARLVEQHQRHQQAAAEQAERDEPLDVAALRSDDEQVEALRRGEDVPGELGEALTAWRDDVQRPPEEEHD